MALNPNDYALVLGINDYPGIKDRSLKGAVRDAERFCDWLRDTAVGGGLPEKNVEIIVSTPLPLKPLKDEVDEALDQTRSNSPGMQGRGATLLFLFQRTRHRADRGGKHTDGVLPRQVDRGLAELRTQFGLLLQLHRQHAAICRGHPVRRLLPPSQVQGVGALSIHGQHCARRDADYRPPVSRARHRVDGCRVRGRRSRRYRGARPFQPGAAQRPLGRRSGAGRRRQGNAAEGVSREGGATAGESRQPQTVSRD